MGISRRRPAARTARTSGVTWSPEADGILLRHGIDMEYEAYAAGNAYGAQFYSDKTPDASLTIWVYPTRAPDTPGRFTLGYCSEQEIPVNGDFRTRVQYTTGDEQEYSSAIIAEQAAHDAAEALNQDGADAAHGDAAGFFYWNGTRP